MRFITEFELNTPFEIKNYKGLRERGSAQWLGTDIAKEFGWEERGETTPDGPVTERHTLEIEAFPMDKWFEFRKILFDQLPEYDQASKLRILNALSDLESFGKSNKNEQKTEQGEGE